MTATGHSGDWESEGTASMSEQDLTPDKDEDTEGHVQHFDGDDDEDTEGHVQH